LGVDPDTELGQFYLNYPPECVRGWYELNRVEDIRRATEFARRELAVGPEYLALTGVEGEGITLYHRATGKVFDVQFGQFEALQAESLPPVASSFVEYLRWCRSKDAEDV